MRSLLLLAGLTLLTLVSTAQTYTYKPLALDTSCFWKSEYYYYDAGFVCQGERVSTVTKDTVIAGYVFFKVETYTTAAPNPPVPMCNNVYLATKVVTFIREDTAARKVYYGDGSVAINFNLNVGDTLSGPSPIPRVVDSTGILQIMGVDRRVQWASNAIFLGRPSFQTIEGIGMNYNFPVGGFGEWGIPVYKLKCFSKGGVVLYAADGSGNCIKTAPLAVKEPAALSRQKFSFEKNQVRIIDENLLPVKAELFDMTGRLVYSKMIGSKEPSNLDLTPGNYLLRLTNDKSAGSYIIPVLP